MFFRAGERPCIHSQLHFQFKCIFAMLSRRSHLLFLVRYVNVVDMCQHNLHRSFYKVVELLMLYSLTS